MACEQGEVSTSVADSMAWSTGEFGLLGGGSASSETQMALQRARRRLHHFARRLTAQQQNAAESEAEDDWPPFPGELISLLEQLTSFGIAMSVLLSLWLIGTCCWRYRCNRKYYRAIREAQAQTCGVKSQQTAWWKWRSTVGSARVAPSVPPSPPSPSPLTSPLASRLDPTEESTASVRLQAAVRRHRAMREVVRIAAARESAHAADEAATHVQRVIRSRTARKSVAATRAALRLQHVVRKRQCGGSSRTVVAGATPLPSPSPVRSPIAPNHGAEAPVGSRDKLPFSAEEAQSQAEAAEGEYEDVEETVEVVVPRFRPLPGFLVWPNLPVLGFWLFNAGLAKKATALLAWQATSGGDGAAGDHRTLDATTVQSPPQCGVFCTLLAVVVLLAVASLLLIGLLMLRHFWVHFQRTCWKRIEAPIKPTDVGDPCFRCWSRLKTCNGCCPQLCGRAADMPSAKELMASFEEHDLDGDNRLNVQELPLALRKLGLLPLDKRRSTRGGTAPSARRQEATMSSTMAQAERRVPQIVRAAAQKHLGRLWSLEEYTELVKLTASSYARTQPRQRGRGTWTKLATDTVEPARTERLLARPFALRREVGGDCQDSMSLTLFAKVSGVHFLGMTWAWSTMCVQVVLGVVSGLGPYIAKGSAAATAQVLSVALVKIGWAALLIVFVPCMDRLVNAVVVAQMLSEGVSALLLLLAALNSTPSEVAASIQWVVFGMLLIPVFFPVIQKAYDGLVVSLILNCCRKKFNPQAACQTLIVLALAIPGFIAKVTGCSGGKFNAASASGTVKSVLGDAKLLKSAGANTVKVTRTVRRRKQHRLTDNVHAIRTVSGAVGGEAAMLQSRESEETHRRVEEAKNHDGDDACGDCGD